MAETYVHYLIELTDALDAGHWLQAAARLRRYFASTGIDLVEFGDAHDLDRDAVREAGSRDYFEGQLYFDGDRDWRRLFSQFFAAEGIRIRQLSGEEERERPEGRPHRN